MALAKIQKDDWAPNSERGVPTFDGTMSNYREYRRRVQVYHLRMRLEDREKLVGLNLLSGLSGAAWEAVEHIDVLGGDAEKGDPKLIASILKELDLRFKYDARTELPTAFENFFYRASRKPRETLLDYLNRMRKLTNSLKEHDVELPDHVQGWLLLRRSGIRADQRTAIMAQLGLDLTLDGVSKAMTFTLGQDSFAERAFKPGAAYTAEDYYDEDYYYNDEEEDDWSWEHGYYGEDFDSSENYYHAEPAKATDEAFNVDEYDECFATYVDARKRMNDLRLARGFYPVVALGPEGAVGLPAAASSSTTPPPRTAPSGKGKPSRKGKGPVPHPKGKGKGQSTSAGQSSSANARASSATGSTTCLRCGKPGHWARNCPEPAGGTKRPRTDGDDMAMLVGATTLEKYVVHLLGKGIDVRDLKVYSCSKHFRFGDDNTGTCDYCALVPVTCGTRCGTILTYVIAGETPFLIGRPVMENLGLAIDFGQQRVKWPGRSWTDVIKGPVGHYMLDLTEDIDALKNRRYDDTDAFCFIPNECEHIQMETTQTLSHYGYLFPNAIPHDSHALDEVSYVDPDDFAIYEKPLRARVLHDLIHVVEEHLLTKRKAVALSRKVRRGRLKCWELFVGEGLTSLKLRDRGASVRSFGLENGWDFFRQTDRDAFKRLLLAEEPDELWTSPMCGPWSQLQELNRLTPEAADRLVQLRQWHHDVILKFTADVYEIQRKAGRHAHFEHPKTARSWRTRNVQRMKGYDAEFDQCAYGLSLPGMDGYCKKPTRVRTTKAAMRDGLAARCTRDHEHVQLMGSIPGGGGSRSKFAENYPPLLADWIAELMTAPESLDEAYPAMDNDGDQTADPEPIHLHRELRLLYGTGVLNHVKRLHANLGHLRPHTLANMLRDAHAQPEVIKCAEAYSCAVCMERIKPASWAKAGILIHRNFNDSLYVDVMSILTGTERCLVLSLVDSATRFLAARLIRAESALDVIRAIERGWIRQSGAMKRLTCDEGRGFCSDEFKAWCERHGVVLRVAPGEAHNRLGPVERRHAVLRESIERYMASCDQAPSSALLEEALAWVPGQINSLAFTRGYTPNQWVLGYQPMDATSLTHDDYSPSVQDSTVNETFNDNLTRRINAATSFMHADASSRLRRAMQRRYRGMRAPAVIGQTVYYWRDQEASKLAKSRWRGPATVATIETRAESGNQIPDCYWVVHGTSLLRCAAEHVRVDVPTQGLETVDNLTVASSALRAVRSRGVTQYIDLTRQTCAPAESDFEDNDDMDLDMDEANDPEPVAPPAAATVFPAATEPLPSTGSGEPSAPEPVERVTTEPTAEGVPVSEPDPAPEPADEPAAAARIRRTSTSSDADSTTLRPTSTGHLPQRPVRRP